MKRDRFRLIALTLFLLALAALIIVSIHLASEYAKRETKTQIDTAAVHSEFENNWAQTIQEEDL